MNFVSSISRALQKRRRRSGYTHQFIKIQKQKNQCGDTRLCAARNKDEIYFTSEELTQKGGRLKRRKKWKRWNGNGFRLVFPWRDCAEIAIKIELKIEWLELCGKHIFITVENPWECGLLREQYEASTPGLYAKTCVTCSPLIVQHFLWNHRN